MKYLLLIVAIMFSAVTNADIVHCSKTVECNMQRGKAVDCRMTENTMGSWMVEAGRPAHPYSYPTNYNLVMVKVTSGNRFTAHAECTYAGNGGSDPFDFKIVGYKVEAAIPESEPGAWEGGQSANPNYCFANSYICLLRIS